MDLKSLAKNLELDEDEFLELVSLFLKTSSSDLNKLQTAIEKGDGQKMAELAHSVKGAAVTLGLTEIFENVKKLETDVKANDLDGAARWVRSIRQEFDRMTKGLNKKVKFKKFK
jgi:HPt (histidine-containing phosphotransfer) domain-containing protein